MPGAGQLQRFAMLAVGCKAGIVWLWRYTVPHQYTPSGSPCPEAFTLVCIHCACSLPEPLQPPSPFLEPPPNPAALPQAADKPSHSHLSHLLPLTHDSPLHVNKPSHLPVCSDTENDVSATAALYCEP